MENMQFKNPLVSYKDATGGKTWSILEPGLTSRFPIPELIWGNYIIKQLEITFVNSADMPPKPSKRIEDLHNMPFIDMLILDGDVK